LPFTTATTAIPSIEATCLASAARNNRSFAAERKKEKLAADYANYADGRAITLYSRP
jgi:hypothetical protein